MKIQFKLLIPVAALCIVLTIALSAIFMWRFGGLVDREFDSNGFALTTILSTNGRIGVLMNDPNQLTKVMDVFEGDEHFRFASFFDNTGKEITTRGTLISSTVIQNIKELKSPEVHAIESAKNEEIQLYVQPVYSRGSDGAPIGFVAIGLSKDELAADQRTSIYLSAGFALLLVGVAIVLFRIIMNKTIIDPINSIVATISNADLNVRFNSKENDEVGELQRAFDTFIESIRQTLTKVQETTNNVTASTTEISSSTEEMAAGSHEQSSQTSEVAVAIEEMTRTLEDSAKNIQTAAETAQKAGEEAQQGGKVVDETIDGMRRISTVVSQSADQVKILGTSSDKIGEIIEVIDDIADQTNLLALNAAIEAARAGEQGRGFAVVADEVRKLAERTSKATKEIAMMIRQIQTDTNHAVVSMQKGTEEVGKGISLAEQAGTMLRNIVGNAESVSSMMQQIATASREQTVTANQISKNVESISSVTQESSSAVQQIAKTADDLNTLAGNLSQLLMQFNLNESDHQHSSKKESLVHKSHSQRSKKAISEDGRIIEHY